jgi:plasmid maintenance system antidote protein VapI
MKTIAPATEELTASYLRGLIAQRRVQIFRLAPRVDVHPSRLSLILHERRPLSPELAQRLVRAIEEEAAAK